MRVTTVRLRPLRKSTRDEVGVDGANVTGEGAELWIGGEFVAVLSMEGEDVCEVVWGTQWADKHHDDIRGMAIYAWGLMKASDEIPNVRKKKEAAW